MDDEELEMDDEDQENVNCKSLNNLVSVLESDGFITKLNRNNFQFKKHFSIVIFVYQLDLRIPLI